ncbi:MAG: CPBP family glutamic-type intramembrane protease [bacterium]|nr:CPBP family glutamic-type intramembrane protease [bacterium]
MERFWEWLTTKEPQGWDSVKLVVVGAIVAATYSVCAYILFRTLGMTFEERSDLQLPTPLALLFLFLFCAAYIEETLFRLPLIFFIWWFVKIRHIRWILLPALLLSMVFGAVHGGMKYILIQGVAGIIFSCVFLKAGALKGKIIEPLLASSLTHFLTNSIIVALAFLGQKVFSILLP